MWGVCALVCGIAVAVGIPVAAGEAPPAKPARLAAEAQNLVWTPARALRVENRATSGKNTRKPMLSARKRMLSARKRALSLPPRKAICHVFGSDCAEAVAVARCESRLQTDARNGQYRGMFQMGTYERRRFGHGDSPYEQAKAAHRYYVLSGKDWSPWTCKPWW